MKLFCCALIFFNVIATETCLAANKTDHILVLKAQHTLYLYRQQQVIATYHVAFGGNSVGHKQQEGDSRTPEGKYLIDSKNTNSGYYKALHISYPNQEDLSTAKKNGVSSGGSIMTHGQKNGYSWASWVVQRFNWTKGCIALSNADMDVVWNAVDVGTPIEIKPY